MSKGLGKQQRRILDELKARPAFYPDELATTRSERVALNRAAWKLADAGLIDVVRFRFGQRKIIVKRCGFEFNRMKYTWKEYEWQKLTQLPPIVNVEQLTG